MPRHLQLDKAGKLKLSEADVVSQVLGFLQLRGWRILRTGYGEIWSGDRLVGTVGEVGQSDYQALRYKTGAYAEVLWIEFKRPKCKGDFGGKLRKSQVDWITLERMQGAMCVVVSDLVEFSEFYRKEIGVR